MNYKKIFQRTSRDPFVELKFERERKCLKLLSYKKKEEEEEEESKVIITIKISRSQRSIILLLVFDISRINLMCKFGSQYISPLLHKIGNLYT